MFALFVEIYWGNKVRCLEEKKSTSSVWFRLFNSLSNKKETYLQTYNILSSNKVSKWEITELNGPMEGRMQEIHETVERSIYMNFPSGNTSCLTGRRR